MPTSHIRSATPADVPAIVGLVHELADYERAAEQVELTEGLLHEALFGADPVAGCELADVEGAVIGMALWYRSYSTWTGRPGLYLEDLYVRPEHRGAGHGNALLRALAGICVRHDWPRLEWAVLDWNTPAIEFYRRLGAAPLHEWTVNRLSGDALRRLSHV